MATTSVIWDTTIPTNTWLTLHNIIVAAIAAAYKNIACDMLTTLATPKLTLAVLRCKTTTSLAGPQTIIPG